MPYLPALYSEDETRYWVSQVMLPTHEVYLATPNNIPQAFAALKDDWLAHLYVAPHTQSQGLGTALLSKAKQASPKGLNLHVFQANARAVHFYERQGFTLVELRDAKANEEGLPDAHYHWHPSLG
ncbi:GNAT family N-acetyltransferase [Bailinhaonella thermotolerans]|uniref:N-acetyltransferase n=1 Tax=Bailinhaonella thermotolerans TaxID=1070861 RepID=A0A3A4ANI4_9ACTN|nr:GNAT family N-acetyltransferase [Bailinhaonella thermotolerans]RJL20794.1 N-acetyltransferase [Bailinhaonella thermotolerans]